MWLFLPSLNIFLIQCVADSSCRTVAICFCWEMFFLWRDDVKTNVKATLRNRGQQTNKIGNWQIWSENSTSDTWESTVPVWELNWDHCAGFNHICLTGTTLVRVVYHRKDTEWSFMRMIKVHYAFLHDATSVEEKSKENSTTSLLRQCFCNFHGCTPKL